MAEGFEKNLAGAAAIKGAALAEHIAFHESDEGAADDEEDAAVALPGSVPQLDESRLVKS